MLQWLPGGQCMFDLRCDDIEAAGVQGRFLSFHLLGISGNRLPTAAEEASYKEHRLGFATIQAAMLNSFAMSVPHQQPNADNSTVRRAAYHCHFGKWQRAFRLPWHSCSPYLCLCSRTRFVLQGHHALLHAVMAGQPPPPYPSSRISSFGAWGSGLTPTPTKPIKVPTLERPNHAYILGHASIIAEAIESHSVAGVCPAGDQGPRPQGRARGLLSHFARGAAGCLAVKVARQMGMARIVPEGVMVFALGCAFPAPVMMLAALLIKS